MPTDISVVSWNINNLGDRRGTVGLTPAPSPLIQFIAQAIALFDADLVGIMELQSGKGQLIGNWLAAQLNNMPGTTGNPWAAQSSARQDGGTMEEYLYLVRVQANRIVLNGATTPGPMFLLGVADQLAFSKVLNINHNDLTDDQKAAFMQELVTQGCIATMQFKSRSKMRYTQTYRVVGPAWTELEGNINVDLQLTQPWLTDQDKADTNVTLFGLDLLKFIGYPDRSPYVGNFLLGTAQEVLTTAMLHAPGPSDPDRFSAINNMSQSAVLQNAASLLLMGDMNVQSYRNSGLASVYTRFPKGLDDKPYYGRASPAAAATVFAPITGGPLNMTSLFNRVKTSVMDRFPPQNADLDGTLSEPYDRMFFRSAGMTATNGGRVDVIGYLNNTAGNFRADPTTTAINLFKDAYRPAWFRDKLTAVGDTSALEAAVKKAQDNYGKTKLQIEDFISGGKAPPTKLQKRFKKEAKTLSRLENGLNNSRGAPTLTTLQQALYGTGGTNQPGDYAAASIVYREVISDHLPVAAIIRTAN